jgi:hypothetical protein
MASAVIASQVKIRIKVQGFTGYVGWWMMVLLLRVQRRRSIS